MIQKLPTLRQSNKNTWGKDDKYLFNTTAARIGEPQQNSHAFFVIFLPIILQSIAQFCR